MAENSVFPSMRVPYQVEEEVKKEYLPQRASDYSQGYDLCAQCDVLVPSYPKIMKRFIETGVWGLGDESYPHTDKESPIFATLIPLNILVEYPYKIFSFLMARSSLSKKKGLILANGVGLIDTDFRDNHRASVINFGPEDVLIQKGEKIIQLVPMRDVSNVILEKVNVIDTKTINHGGSFGSSGGYKEKKEVRDEQLLLFPEDIV